MPPGHHRTAVAAGPAEHQRRARAERQVGVGEERLVEALVGVHDVERPAERRLPRAHRLDATGLGDRAAASPTSRTARRLPARRPARPRTVRGDVATPVGAAVRSAVRRRSRCRLVAANTRRRAPAPAP